MRPIPFLVAAALLLAACGDPVQPNTATAPGFHEDWHARDVVRVANPSGDAVTDVENINAAVAAAEPGSIIQFGPGIYRIRQTTTIVVSVPRVTLRGHPDGTIIRGGFNPNFFLANFVLHGGHQTVRRLTFERFSFALVFGEPGTTTGGYRVEHCTFRNGHVPFQIDGFSDEVSTFSDNAMINVSQAFAIVGKTVHLRRNSITAPDPAAAPFGQPFSAGALLPDFLRNVCENNVLEENTISNNADGFIIAATDDQRCRGNVIRRNTVIGQRVFTEFDNGTMVWAAGPGVRGNLIENNLLRGSQGLGVVVDSGSGNRIVENEFRNLPGRKETFTPFPGTAIFLGEPTSGNRVARNEFRNVVEAVVDLGTDNIVRGNVNVERSRERAPVTLHGRTLDHRKLSFLPARTR